jgi:hypothetical protein
MVTVNELLAERKKTHGSFEEHARCTQELLETITKERNWNKLSPEYREGIHMILHKLGRIATGNPYHVDHVADIQGYAKLMENYAEQVNSYRGADAD